MFRVLGDVSVVGSIGSRNVGGVVFPARHWEGQGSRSYKGIELFLTSFY